MGMKSVSSPSPVDTPPTHPASLGRWRDILQFPLEVVEAPLTFQAVVHTRLGSIPLDWPVKVGQ
jgi:hypothetical protein